MDDQMQGLGVCKRGKCFGCDCGLEVEWWLFEVALWYWAIDFNVWFKLQLLLGLFIRMSNLYEINEEVKNLPENSSPSQSIILHNIIINEDKLQKTTIQCKEGKEIRLPLIISAYPKRPTKAEISFEKHFLLEHTKSLDRQLQNFLEFAFRIKPKQKNEGIQAIKGLYLSSANHVNVVSFLKSQHVPSWDTHMDMFSKGLQEDDDIQGFSKHLISCCSRQLALELLTIVLEVWTQFRNQDFKFKEKKEILKKASDWAKKKSRQYYRSENFALLNCKIFGIQNPEDINLIEQAFGNFVRFISSTVILILAGFFQNPYFDPNYTYQEEADVDHHKRWFSYAFSDFLSQHDSYSDDSFSPLPSKKYKQN